MVIVMILTQAPFYPTLLLLPIPIFYTFIFAVGLGMLLAALTVFFRDIAHFYGVFILAWTYFTPIFYPVEILPQAALTLMKLNPMYHYVSYMRNLILYGQVPGVLETWPALP